MDADLVGPAGTEAITTRVAVTPPAAAPPTPSTGRATDGAVRSAEPSLLGLLAAWGALAAWTTGAGSGPWSACAAVAVLAGSAWLAERHEPHAAAAGNLRLARAVLCLSAAAVAAGGHPAVAPVTLAWLPAVCAVYAVLLAPRAAAALTLGALAVLAVLAAHATGPARPSTAVALAAGAVLAAALAGGTMRAVLLARADGDDVAGDAAEPDVDPVAEPTVESVVDPSARPVVEPAAQPPAASIVHAPAAAGRDLLIDALARAQSRSGVVGGRVGLLVVTVDPTGSLRRELGQSAAQEVLDILARRARALLPAGDVVAWLGATRLGVLLEGVDARTCAVVARRLSGLLAEPVEAGRLVLTLPSLVAVAIAADPGETPLALLARAEAMPAVPAEDLPVAPPAQTRREADGGGSDLAAELWPALCAGDVRVAYQPIVALGTLARYDRVVAVEALARWTRADGVAVPPARFVAAARRSGLVDLLGAGVLAQGLDELTARRAAGAGSLGLAVNVAPEQLAAPGFAAGVLRALNTRDVEAPAVTIELPAAASLDDVAAAAGALQELRSGGVRVVLDNFGATGLSLAALRELPLTGVKLDRALTADLGGDDRLVVATVRLANRLGLHCTAVGVETPGQLDAARGLGVDAVQGHLLGRPEAGGEAADRAAPVTVVEV
jgi:EAL domain-containing protein (putative c-di-GMP-specific phosphodiesterase class I)/GGDEF domain-containing protein